jgi:cysteine desulfurase
VANAHKLYGPKGAAILYCSRKNPRVKLSPLLAGGGQEAGLFPGTLNVPAIVGMAAAFQLASNRFWDDSALISPIRTRFEQQLEDQQLVFINGSTKSRIYTTTNLLSRTISASQLIKKLPQYCFSVGSACTSSKEQPSHVLTAMGLTKTEVLNSFRISFGRDSIGINLENMISDFIAALKSEN